MTKGPRRRTIKKILVDIDSTLYDAGRLFVKYFAKLHGIKIPARIESWDFWQDYISAEEFKTLIRLYYHSPKEILAAKPFPGAVEAIADWYSEGRQIYIVSDRDPSTSDATKEWLRRIGLPYHRIILRNPIDKVEYALAHKIDLVIDDKPETIERSAEAGLAVASLIYRYNREVLARHPEVVAASSWPVLRRRIEERFFERPLLPERLPDDAYLHFSEPQQDEEDSKITAL